MTVTLSGDDGSRGHGVAVTAYNLDDQGWTTYSEPFRVTRRGTHQVAFRWADAVGNIEATRNLRLKFK